MAPVAPARTFIVRQARQSACLLDPCPYPDANTETPCSLQSAGVVACVRLTTVSRPSGGDASPATSCTIAVEMMRSAVDCGSNGGRFSVVGHRRETLVSSRARGPANDECIKSRRCVFDVRGCHTLDGPGPAYLAGFTAGQVPILQPAAEAYVQNWPIDRTYRYR